MSWLSCLARWVELHLGQVSSGFLLLSICCCFPPFLLPPLQVTCNTFNMQQFSVFFVTQEINSFNNNAGSSYEDVMAA